MTMYAANAGKSGGEFFTPQEVSELLTRIATHGKSEVNKVYDRRAVLVPCCCNLSRCWARIKSGKGFSARRRT